MTGYESTSEIDIAAQPDEVWSALTDNARFGDAMFGTEVVTDWGIGSPIVYRGEFEGKSFEDKGEVVELSPPTRMRLTHFSPTSGDEDKPENYHELRFDLAASDAGTHVTLTQDNNSSEKAAEHSKGNWDMLLERLKGIVEK
jgi:uncharacterized protein YndB with AHSA1/START domain